MTTLAENIDPWPEGTVLVVDRNGLLCTGFDPVAVVNERLGAGLVDQPLMSRSNSVHECAAAGAERHRQHPGRYPTPIAQAAEAANVSNSPFDPTVDGSIITTRVPFVMLPGPQGFQAHIHTAHSYSLDTADVQLLVTAIPGTSYADLEPTARAMSATLVDADMAALEHIPTVQRIERLIALGFLSVAAQDAPRPTQTTMRSPLPTRPRDGGEAFSVGTLSSTLPVIAVATEDDRLPLCLGYVQATLADNDALRSHIQTTTVTPDRVPTLVAELANSEAVWLFAASSPTAELAAVLSKRIKTLAPRHVIVHMGSTIPHIDAALVEHLSAHRDIDVAVVGEAEITTLETVSRIVRTGTDPNSWSAMPHGAARISATGTLIRSPERERIAALSHIPSPYLSGILEGFTGDSSRMAIIETVRGCPFQCAGCDCAAGPQSQTRKHPLDRVFAELAWIAHHNFETLVITDVNFGSSPRDQVIAEHLADLKGRTGHPKNVVINHVKHPNPRLRSIAEALVHVGMLPISAITLAPTVGREANPARRANVGPAESQRLREVLHKSPIQLSTELVVGLPAATVSSWRDDLQFMVDTELRVSVTRWRAPSNSLLSDLALGSQWETKTDPALRSQWGIKTDPDGQINETRSASRSDLRHMLTDFAAVYGADGLGWFRLPLRKIAQQTNEPEVDLICRLQRWVLERQEDFPLSSFLLTAGSRWAISPAPWSFVFDELRRAAEACWGAKHWTAWRSVATAQEAILPQRGDTYPRELALDHDVVRWWDGVSDAKRRYPGAWRQHAVRLALMPEATLRVDDTAHRAGQAFGEVTSLVFGARWDLDTPVGRVPQALRRRQPDLVDGNTAAVIATDPTAAAGPYEHAEG